MIFRDKKTGALLNIRKDDFINDRLYYQEIIQVVGVRNENISTKPPRYTTPFMSVK